MKSTIIDNINAQKTELVSTMQVDNFMALYPGTFLRDGNYRIEEIIGQGGFGFTYLAYDLVLERRVAIKEFFPQSLCDRNDKADYVNVSNQNVAGMFEKLKAKFIKEAINIAKFDNPSIIKIYTAFEENNTAYYVMDYIEGDSLANIVASRGALSIKESVKLINEVGSALDYIHHHKITHLDVKPANIMIRRSDDRAILIDFGLSKQYDSDGKQTSTTISGLSHGYAPLEQYSAAGVHVFSPQTDIYALAASLYYSISGIEPPQAIKLLENELQFPEHFPTKLIKVIRKAMSPKRANRQENISQFLYEINKNEINKQKSYRKKFKFTTKKNMRMAYALTGIGIIFILILNVAIFLVKNHYSHNSDINDDLTEAMTSGNDTKSSTVTEMYYQSALGPCSYTGVVNETGKPNGEGRAEWASGIGKYYDGEWKNGDMDGTCEYGNRDGYTFRGEFKDNHYSSGRITNPDGSYYEGTFDKEGMKWNGTEYSKNGVATDTWKNGK